MMGAFIGGADPGQKGAIAVLDEKGDVVWIEDMPIVNRQVLPAGLKVAADNFELVAIGIEKVASMPRQGVASSFNFGLNYGILLGFFGSTHRVIDVRPVDWKKTLKVGGSDKKAQKARAQEIAIQRWPNWYESLKLKKHEGRWEALLIAEHTRRLLLEEGVI